VPSVGSELRLREGVFESMAQKQHINMKFCFKLQKKKSANETHEMLKLVYGDYAVAMKTVYKCFERLRNGCESVEDKERSGTSFNIKNPRECWTSKGNDSMKQAIDH